MLDNPNSWEKLGCLLKAEGQRPWLASHTGASWAIRSDGGKYDVYITGRDSSNRSLIGRGALDLDRPRAITKLSAKPVLGLGELGAFDEAGVSYPCLVKRGNDLFLYYVGWMPTVLTPFQNHLGLAASRDGGPFQRVSRAPIMERNDDDFLSIGSACVLREGSLWRMWYTSFLGWGKRGSDPKHRYLVKYATSKNGIDWERKGQRCMELREPAEMCLARPAVFEHRGIFHMWYSMRGERYRIGYSWSRDGMRFERRDDLAGIAPAGKDWESDSICYPHVFQHGGYLYMLYCGNDYGRGGLGLARLKLA